MKSGILTGSDFTLSSSEAMDKLVSREAKAIQPHSDSFIKDKVCFIVDARHRFQMVEIDHLDKPVGINGITFCNTMDWYNKWRIVQ